MMLLAASRDLILIFVALELDEHHAVHPRGAAARTSARPRQA